MNQTINNLAWFIYVITDNHSVPIINLHFKVEFKTIDNQKYIECTKAHILLETDNFLDAKMTFQQIIDSKVRGSIAKNEFYDLLDMWNFELINNPHDLLKESIDNHLNQNRKNNSKIYVDSANSLDYSNKFNINKQFKYSAAMINSFTESYNWLR